MGFEGGSGGQESADSLGERRGGFVKTSPDVTAMEEAVAGPFAWGPFFPLAGGTAAWA